MKDYGFGVAVVQPSRLAFAERNAHILWHIVVYALTILAVGFFVYRILRNGRMFKEQRDRERIMLGSIGDGVVAIDRDWNIILWNKAASTITGYSEEEALGKPLRSVLKFIREHDRKEEISFIEDAIVMGKVSFMEAGTVLVRKDGSEVAVSDSAAPVAGLDGGRGGAIIVFRDTSKEHEAMRLRSDFSYASHQLRTPITEALWNLETAIREQNSEKKKDDLHVAYQSLLDVRKLLEHLVSVSELDQGNLAVKLVDVKLIDVLSDAQNRIEEEAKNRGVAVSIAPVSPLMAVKTDRKLLTAAIFEVIENAVMYSHRDATVAVTAALENKNLVIEVADTGIGISEQEQPIIFTKFYRGSNKGENVGDGLGLYIAKAYVALLRGKIWFDSKEGTGTTFFISIPVA